MILRSFESSGTSDNVLVNLFTALLYSEIAPMLDFCFMMFRPTILFSSILPIDFFESELLEATTFRLSNLITSN